jgi:FkbM family methyltransferase
MTDIFTRVLRSRKVLLGRDFYQSRQVKCDRLTFGNRYANWTFCPGHLDEHSVIYSFGVGEDVSFDLKLIDQYKLHIHAFDPSPRSIKWVQEQNLTEKFHFYPFGLAGKDGSVVFSEPAEPGHRSLKMTGSDQGEETGLKTHLLTVYRLPTILGKLKHNKIDVLKMDIEGAEYEVIDDIIHSSVPISQILIEFHHRFDGIGIGMTRQAVSKLNEAGYKIFNVSASGEEISLIKTSS